MLSAVLTDFAIGDDFPGGLHSLQANRMTPEDPLGVVAACSVDNAIIIRWALTLSIDSHRIPDVPWLIRPCGDRWTA